MSNGFTPLQFSSSSTPALSSGQSWKILVVDDEPSVHQVTKNVLSDFNILGRSLVCHSAYNEVEAKRLFQDHPDAAVCLLDVVMDSKDTGLKLVEFVRNELGNHQLRIVLRTGQPGMAPERQVFETYDINDYKTKTELTDTRLYLTLLAALRDFDSMARLSRQNDFLADLMDSMPEMHVVLDQQLQITNINTIALNYLKLDRHQIEDKDFFELFDWLKGKEPRLRQAIDHREVTRLERIKRGGLGGGQYYDLLIYPLSTQAGVALVLQDVTLKRRYEAMMIQSEKMLSVGGLAAGVAHEINNPLSTIHQAAQNVSRRLSSDLAQNLKSAEECGLDMSALHRYLEKRKVLEFLDHVTEAAERASSIVETMLRFSRRAEARKSSTDLNQLVLSTIELVGNDLDLKKRYHLDKIRFKTHLAKHLALTPVEVTEVQQVFYNLIKNAAQALAEGNTPHPTIEFTTRVEPNAVVVEVCDNGPGMDEEVRAHILEPFYTTKKIGEGTGLGLAVSYFIVTNNHGGQFEIHSEPGQGTQVHLKFPLVDQHAD